MMHVEGAGRHPLFRGVGGDPDLRVTIYGLSKWGRAHGMFDRLHSALVNRQSSIVNSPNMYDPAAQRFCQGRRAIVHVEFLEDALDMGAGGVAADAQRGGDFLVSLARRQ